MCMFLLSPLYSCLPPVVGLTEKWVVPVSVHQPRSEAPHQSYPVTTGVLQATFQAAQTWRQAYARTANDPGGDLAVGVVLQAALKAGLSMQSIRVHGAGALDIGTPENLAKAVRLDHS